MNLSVNGNKSLREIRRWLAAVLSVMLIATTFSSIASAADETVTGIELSYDSWDYNNSTSSLEVFIDDDAVIVSLLAATSSSSTKKDVSASATWKSSNTSYVKVDKGVLTAVGKGTATISATYGGYTQNIKVTSDYVYDSVQILKNGSNAAESYDVSLGAEQVFTLSGIKSGASNENITTNATWTSSSSSVATVDDGTVTLVGTGTTTITAKYKGKSDTVKLVVTSPYKSLALSPKTLLEIDMGDDDQTIQAIATTTSGSTETVTTKATWTTSSAAVATVEDGVVTPVATGQTKITATYLGVSSTIDVVVRTPYQSIKLSPAKEYQMMLNSPGLQITAEVQGLSGNDENVTTQAEWTSSNLIVATVTNGLVTPKAVGTTKITASIKGISRSIDITVFPSVSELTIDKESIDTFPEKSETLPKVSGTTFGGDTADVSKIVKWTVADEKIATIEDGKWTAVAVGKAVVTAELNGLKATFELNVHLTPVKLVPSTKELSVVIGKDSALPTITVVNQDGSEEDVSSKATWKASSDNAIVVNGKVKGLEASKVTLTATYLNKTTTVKAYVEEEIEKLVAEPSSLELYPGKSKSVKVTGYYVSGKKVVLSSKMNWTVSSSTLATVNGSTVKALAVGSGKLTGSYQGKTLEIPITVSPKLKSLTLSDKSLKLSPGASYSLKLQANYTTGNPADVTTSAAWVTSKASVATVSNGKIIALSKGSATIKATFDGKTVSMRVTVK
ncbi:bacterial surface protein [Paenibacillus algorifonticola]|uniref:Ig-like domain-containing protein n=1 Tax=Paenibacillus algorifonticola TaxID=684063 RepID=UPI003D2849D6